MGREGAFRDQFARTCGPIWATLQRHGKLTRITVPINKDTELMPLGALAVSRTAGTAAHRLPVRERDQRQGESLSGGGAVGIYAGSSDIYAIGMGCKVSEIRKRWQEARANPIPLRIVAHGTVQEEVQWATHCWSVHPAGFGVFGDPVRGGGVRWCKGPRRSPASKSDRKFLDAAVRRQLPRPAERP